MFGGKRKVAGLARSLPERFRLALILLRPWRNHIRFTNASN